jgi:hypothetical protein
LHIEKKRVGLKFALRHPSTGSGQVLRTFAALQLKLNIPLLVMWFTMSKPAVKRRALTFALRHPSTSSGQVLRTPNFACGEIWWRRRESNPFNRNDNKWLSVTANDLK